MNYKNSELKDITLWLYYDIKYSGTVKNVKIFNSLITDLYPDQNNLLIFTYKNTQKALKFSKKNTQLTSSKTITASQLEFTFIQLSQID